MASRLLADGLIVIVLATWWMLAQRLPPIVLPDPWSVAKALAMLFYDPESLQHIAATGTRVIGSVVLATVIAAVLAGLAYYVPVLQDVVLLRIQPFLGAMPSVGWAIVGLIWFKVSDFTVVFIQVAILVPFCLINFTQGMRELDAELIEMGRSFTRSRRLVLTKLIVPLLLPYAVASLRDRLWGVLEDRPGVGAVRRRIPGSATSCCRRRCCPTSPPSSPPAPGHGPAASGPGTISSCDRSRASPLADLKPSNPEPNCNGAPISKAALR